MAAFYRNLTRHLTDDEVIKLDAIVAAAKPGHGIATSPQHEHPRAWVENIDADAAKAIDQAIERMGVIHHAD